MRPRDREIRRQTRHSTTSSTGRHLRHNWSDPQTGGGTLRGTDPIQAGTARASGVFAAVEGTQRDNQAAPQHNKTGYPIDPEFEWLGRNRSTKDDNRTSQEKTPVPGNTIVAEPREPPLQQGGGLVQQVLRLAVQMDKTARDTNGATKVTSTTERKRRGR